MEFKDSLVIVLAAGLSSRTSIPKGLIRNQRGESWIVRQILALHRVGLEKIVIVLGYHKEKYAEEVAQHISHPELKWVENLNPAQGPFSSLQVGLKSASNEIKSFFILPLDTPVPEAALWSKMWAQLPVKSKFAIKPTCQSKGGHPVLLSRGFGEYLCALDPVDSSSRLDLQLLELEKIGNLSYVSTIDDRCVMNLNTDQDYESRQDHWADD